MANISERDRELGLAGDSHLSGTMTDDEFHQCIAELKEKFPEKSQEELEAMCYELSDQVGEDPNFD